MLLSTCSLYVIWSANKTLCRLKYRNIQLPSYFLQWGSAVRTLVCLFVSFLIYPPMAFFSWSIICLGWNLRKQSNYSICMITTVWKEPRPPGLRNVGRDSTTFLTCTAIPYVREVQKNISWIISKVFSFHVVCARVVSSQTHWSTDRHEYVFHTAAGDKARCTVTRRRAGGENIPKASVRQPCITSSRPHYSLPPVTITHVSTYVQEKRFFSQLVVLGWISFLRILYLYAHGREKILTKHIVILCKKHISDIRISKLLHWCHF